MQLRNAMLNRIIMEENLREAIQAIPPNAVGVAALLEDGTSMDTIAALFGVSRSAIDQRLQHARALVADAVPELGLVYNGSRCEKCGRPLTKGATRLCSGCDDAHRAKEKQYCRKCGKELNKKRQCGMCKTCMEETRTEGKCVLCGKPRDGYKHRSGMCLPCRQEQEESKLCSG